MGLISDLKPLNAPEEREKFLNSTSYNPQFEYRRSFTPEEMSRYGQPSAEYFKHAKQMLDAHGPPVAPSESICTPAEVRAEVEQLFAELNLPALRVTFKPQTTSQAAISEEGLIFRLPIRFNLNSLKNKLNHEVQTHYLRKYNQSLQSWQGTNQQTHPKQFRSTEEGLANLHSYIGREELMMKKTYLNYYAAYRATRASFRELYVELIKYGISEPLAWNLTLKQKRGLNDTSLPGGYPKNHLYFEGAVSVWNWILRQNNDLKLLYQGRISLSDADKLSGQNLHPEAVYPTFYRDQENYRSILEELGQVNQLEKLPNLYPN